MSTEMLSLALEMTGLRPRHKLLLVVLADVVAHDGSYDVAILSLANKTNTSVGCVQKDLTFLTKLGFITLSPTRDLDIAAGMMVLE